ncbi:putative Glycine-rich RNA-binding protein [Quillaja saponaria]|uniref:Glycine-rich RNA-binding protein n=1 Tax=Quillaja saponaria TaxID=32244 RepID=A0AAD7PI55_QUISA|nr:putative Glycine-rich RNA-binding protein [Quillaja saponaria]
MAFFSKVGNILRQNASKQIISGMRSTPSIFQAIRCMSSKLFIGGISYSTDEQSLREAFAKYGEVVDARVIVDRETGRSRGFGFVTFTSDEEASSALQALDGQELHGRQVRVNYANDRTRGFGGGGGGSGGYGGSGFGNAPSWGAGGGGSYGESGAYGGNSAGGFGGGGGGYNSGNYGGAGSGDNYSTGGTYNSNYGAESTGTEGTAVNYGESPVGYGNANNFGTGNAVNGGSTGGYGGNNGIYGVAGGGGDASSSFASGGYDGSSQFGQGGSGQLDKNESNKINQDAGYFKEEPLEGNFRDDDDAGDFAKRA